MDMCNLNSWLHSRSESRVVTEVGPCEKWGDVGQRALACTDKIQIKVWITFQIPII